MILSQIKNYINLIFKKEKHEIENEILPKIEKYQDKEKFKLLFTRSIHVKALKLELIHQLNEDDIYKVIIKAWAKGQNDETIVCVQPIKKLMHIKNIDETVQTITETIAQKREYYNIANIYITELIFMKVNKITSNDED